MQVTRKAMPIVLATSGINKKIITLPKLRPIRIAHVNALTCVDVRHNAEIKTGLISVAFSTQHDARPRASMMQHF